MSYAYADKKKTEKAVPGTETAPQGPSLEALRSGAARPTAAQMGRRVDLPDAMRTKMENAFGADLSAVRLYESQTVGDAGADAVAQGSSIAFAPGALDFSSYSGQALLGHEISHVVSQARGEVSQRGGFLNDRALEARADREGAMAAAGQTVAMPTGALSSVSAAPAAGPMQAGKRSRTGAAKAANNDFSDYANVEQADRQQLLNLKKSTIAANMQAHRSLKQVYGSTTSDMLNPVTRQAMSEMAQTTQNPKERKKLTAAMEAMDQQMLVQTMMPPTAAQQTRLENHYATGGSLKRLQREYKEAGHAKWRFGDERLTSYRVNDLLDYLKHGGAQAQQNFRHAGSAAAARDLFRSQKSGDAMLRMMLLMQMGNFKRTDTLTDAQGQSRKITRNWDRSMANAFSHGARIGFVFGETSQGADGQTYDTGSVFNALFAGNKDAAGVKDRSAATHRLLTPAAGQGMRGYEEEHGFGAARRGWLDSGYHNYGMNMAIGGAGNEGIQGPGGQGQIITDDGRSGHMYMGVRDSTDAAHGATRGGMLIGLESDSPYRMNQMGHMHTMAAVSEENSSTGGMKTDISGDKYGGRTVDFDGASNEDIVTALNAFTAHIDRLRSGNAADQARYVSLVKEISGKRIKTGRMNALMAEFLSGNGNQQLRDRLARVRAGQRPAQRP